MAKVQVSHRDRTAAQAEAERLAAALGLRVVEGEDVLGPSPAPVTRMKRLYSFQLFVRAEKAEALHRVLEPALSYAGRARVRVDVDPRDIGTFLD